MTAEFAQSAATSRLRAKQKSWKLQKINLICAPKNAFAVVVVAAFFLAKIAKEALGHWQSCGRRRRRAREGVD